MRMATGNIFSYKLVSCLAGSGLHTCSSGKPLKHDPASQMILRSRLYLTVC